ncbi:MAG: hypothetical protein KDI33_05995 [Halioglobus sp.]|nr:hypothetical protein [Halioglobus sp.]
MSKQSKQPDLRHDYSGAFDPQLMLEDFSRDFLSRLAHEFNLIGHLFDRVAQPLVAIDYGREGFTRSGIEEWQGASPIYSKRMQRALGFEGDTVETVFKNIQLEVGSPQQFMDFQFRLDEPDYGEFWLAHCGALMDLENNGNDTGFIQAMCHDIEDPTFDATAAATHPRIVVRPLHRPPRIDVDGGNGVGRYPHCRWKVYKEEEDTTFEHHSIMYELQKSLLAGIALVAPEETRETGGLDDYSGQFDPHLQFEDFSHRALQTIIQENAVQALLLSHSYTRSQTINYGDEVGRRFSERSWVGHGRVAVERFQKNLGLDGDDIETMAKIFQLHPNFYPRTYVDFNVDITGPNSLRLSIGDCPALAEAVKHNWFSQLSADPHPALESIAAHVNPRARCHKVDDYGGSGFAWDIVIDEQNTPMKEPFEMQIARSSGGVNFKFERRRMPGVIARG